MSVVTKRIALGTASVILPLRHPLHVAKSAASVDVLSGGRSLLGVATGDRPEEYPAMEADFHSRGERFRNSFDYIEQVVNPHLRFANPLGTVGGGVDMLPKPTAGRIPLLITGGSQQDPLWAPLKTPSTILTKRDLTNQGDYCSQSLELGKRIDAEWSNLAKSLGAGLGASTASSTF